MSNAVYDLFNQPPTAEESISLTEAREYVKNGREDGTYCPCCHQFVKLYKRKLNSGMAKALIYLYVEYFKTAQEWIQVKDFLREHKYRNNHDWTLLRFWGLLEQDKNNDEDGKVKTNGMWRITAKGMAFVNDPRVRIPKHILIYNNKFLGFSDDDTNIKESLKNDFFYAELMNHETNN